VVAINAFEKILELVGKGKGSTSKIQVANDIDDPVIPIGFGAHHDCGSVLTWC
jgi:hypothetical protein